MAVTVVEDEPPKSANAGNSAVLGAGVGAGVIDEQDELSVSVYSPQAEVPPMLTSFLRLALILVMRRPIVREFDTFISVLPQLADSRARFFPAERLDSKRRSALIPLPSMFS